MNILFYHVYLTDDAGVWSSIILEQLKCMEDSGLLENLNEMNVNVITQDDVRIHRFIDVVHSFMKNTKCSLQFRLNKNPYANDDVMLGSIESDETITENATMRWIYEKSKTVEANICYVHTKGITSLKRHLLSGNHQDFMKYYYWRQYLNWGVLERWKECVDALDQHDIAGINYQTDPTNHYSGNFWWATTKHIRSLPDPETKDWWYKLKNETDNSWLKSASDRFRDEQWHCSRVGTKAFNIHTMNNNPASHIIRRKEYDAEII